MRNPLLAAWLAAVCTTAWTQSAPPDPQQLLDSALQRSDLFHHAAQPFVLEADLTVQLSVPTQGKILIRWGAKDRWREEIKIGPFTMVKTKNGEQTLTLRNAPFTPQRVKDLASLIRLNPSEQDMSAHSLKQHHQNGQLIDCVEYTVSGSLHACMDPSTGDLVSMETKSFDGIRRAEYSDFVDFDGLRLPHHLRLLTSGGYVLSVNVTRLAAEPFDDKLFDLPKEAIARRECDGEKPPMATQTSEIDGPGGTPIGNSAMTVTVLQDGSVGDVEVNGSTSQAVNDAVAKELKKWKFKPAMCGSDPVVADIVITTTVQHY